MFDYHYGMEAEQYAFYRITKILMNNPHFAMVSMEVSVSNIRNSKAYLLESLFNASVTIGNYYSEKVKYDLYREM
ncbi:MAG: hypothetical protein II993_04665 [Anaerotignum sp.]|nr:hypothetical protein [Anaerotignum sp.]MBQ7085833.1 hypothetical protein [Anaerotignum sp.]